MANYFKFNEDDDPERMLVVRQNHYVDAVVVQVFSPEHNYINIPVQEAKRLRNKLKAIIKEIETR